MSFDGIFLHHMTAELQPLVGGRIQKINQPFDQELVLTIRSAGKSHKLLLSAHPVFGRVQLTKTDFQNPQNPNNFVMILRKYLAGAFLEKIEQVENDRQIIFHISTKDEIGDSLKIALIAEIMGKHSNIILLEKTSQKIIESINILAFRKINIGRFCLAQPISHHLLLMLLTPLKQLMKKFLMRYKLNNYNKNSKGLGAILKSH